MKLSMLLIMLALATTGCITEVNKSVNGNYNMDGNWLVSGTYVYEDEEGTEEGTVTNGLLTVDQVGDSGVALSSPLLPAVNQINFSGDRKQFVFGHFIMARIQTAGFLTEEEVEVDYEVRYLFLQTDGSYAQGIRYTQSYKFNEVVSFEDWLEEGFSEQAATPHEIRDLHEIHYEEGILNVPHPVTGEIIRTIALPSW